MTLFHFGNCFALAYVPYFITYKFSGLSEYSAFWKCVQAGGLYMFTQLCKMLVLATFFPESEGTLDILDIIGDVLKSTVDLADFVGIYFIMFHIAGKGEIKFMIAGLGWATAELVMTKFLPLWVGARGVEFDWKFIQMSLDSNISLVQHIAMAMLIWLWSRSDLNKSLYPVIISLLLLGNYKPLVMILLEHLAGISSWLLLFLKALYTGCIGLTTLQLYVSLTLTAHNHYT